VTTPEEHPAALWRRLAGSLGDDYADKYADRFDAMAARGEDVHGEADLLNGMLAPGSRVLDAGCGTGRVGKRLHDLGHVVVGVDADDAMVDAARRRSPGPRWEVADLATLDLHEQFDLVVMAGNIVPFLPAGRLDAAMERVAAHLVEGGAVVCGYGLDADHVPKGVPLIPLADYDAACEAAGLRLERRFDGWDGAAYTGAGYVVSVHRRSPEAGAEERDQS
jgi:SAM-dependent methyltransferase